MKSAWAIALLLVATATAARGESFVGRVVAVADGDTVSVMRGGSSVRVRLEGIDAPEHGQAYGARAKQALSGMVFARDVRVDVRGVDRYGRTLGRILAGGLDVNLELVRGGWAWHNKRYSSERALAEAEVAARAGRRGLWADPKPTPPWEWRRERREE